MALPIYSEVSNFSLKKNEIKKLDFLLSCVFITDNLSSSIESLNSIYSFINESKHNVELIIINLDKITYNYEKLFSTFPFVRILFIKGKVKIKDLFLLGIEEARSKNVLFLNQDFEIINLDFELINPYISELSFGIVIPLIFNEEEEIIPNTVKMNYNKGLLTTNSIDIIETTIYSLYAKYFCFIVNKNIFIENMELYDYENEDYFLLELGYKIWKNGFTITQARNFKVVYKGNEKEDIQLSNELEYIIFNLRNISNHINTKGRFFYLLLTMIKKFLLLDFNYISSIKKAKKRKKEHYPVEDFEIMSIINKEITS